jgi:hypothetical protein
MRQGGRKEREGVCGGCTDCSCGATAVLRVLQVEGEGERRRRLSEPNRSWQLAGDKEDSRRGIQRRSPVVLCLSSSDKARWRAAEDSRGEGMLRENGSLLPLANGEAARLTLFFFSVSSS